MYIPFANSAKKVSVPQTAKRMGWCKPVFESAPEFSVRLPKCINQTVYAAAANDNVQISVFFIFCAFCVEFCKTIIL